METIKRKSCRAVILTPQNEILLIKIENPYGHWSGWITPGGGIEKDENEEKALARELHEELGVVDMCIGPKIWIRFHSFPWQGKEIEQSESFYLIHADKFEPNPIANIEDAVNLKVFRWWTIDEIKHSNENFAPQSIYQHLERLVKYKQPGVVIKVGM